MRLPKTLVIGVALAAAVWAWRHHPPGAAFAVPGFGVAHAPAATDTLWLGDFESPQELSQWEARNVKAELVEEHVTHGRHAAKVTFEKTQEPAFRLALDNDAKRYDWRNYESLGFDLYNPQHGETRIILQLKDDRERVYKEDIFLSGDASQQITVRLKTLAKYLNLAHLDEVTLFRWKPGHSGTVFIDGVHLAPAASAGAGAAAPVGVKVEKAWRVLWASSLVKLPRDPAQAPALAASPVQMSLARNEYESVQLVLVGGVEQAARVQVQVGPITSESGVAFPADVVEIRSVGYVQTHEPYYPAAYVGKWPDPLPLASAVDVPANRVQPVWITLGAPSGMPAGRYQGVVTLTDDAGRTASVPLQVRVRDFSIDRISHLKSAFDFYPSRLKEAYEKFVPGGQVWADRLNELKRLYYLDMLKHRIAPVMSVDPTKDGFAREFVRYRAMGLTAFGIGTHGGTFANNWPHKGPELDKLIGWYRSAARALRAAGALQTAYVYAYDEPKPGAWHPARVMAMLHQADPGLRTLLVMHTAPQPSQNAEWLKDADILCIRIASYDTAHAEQFKRMGKEMWLYISSPSHPFPALVIDYPSIAYRILPWMCWKYHVAGLLYWCVDFWKGDPWKNPANFTPDQNGNGSLYYPAADGPVPSIRMEVLRDGMEDYEYLYRLNQLAEASRQRGGVAPALLAKAAAALAVDPSLVESLRAYADDPQALLAQREAVADLIEALQAALAAGPADAPPAAG